jgi:hypothetical protein
MKKFLWSFAAVLAVISISFAVITCGDSGTPTRPTAVTGVSIEGRDPGPIGQGNTFTLTAVLEPANATNRTVTWTSSNPAEVSVTKRGNTLVADVKGEAITTNPVTITVTTADGSFTATRTFTVVTPVDVTGISLNKDTLPVRIRANGTDATSTTVTAEITPPNATNKDVTWEIDDESIASFTLSHDGLTATVTAKKIGTTTITVTAVDGDWSDSAEIVVTERSSDELDVESVTINSHNALWSVPPGYVLTGVDESRWEYMTITATVDPPEADFPELLWEVSSVAVGTDTAAPVVSYTVSEDTMSLYLRALLNGTITITATAESYPDIKDTSTVRLKLPVESVVPQGLVMVLTESTAVQTAHSVFAPTYCEADEVSDWDWSITDTNIATLTGGNTATPTVTAKAAGTTKLNVSVKVDGLTFTGDVDLVVRNPTVALLKDFHITFEGYATDALVAPAGINYGTFTNEVPGHAGEEVLVGRYGKLNPDNADDDAIGWLIDLTFKEPIIPELINQYTGVKIEWGHSVVPDGSVMDACGMFTVRFRCVPGDMLTLDLGQGRGSGGPGWYQPAGGIPMGGTPWSFTQQNTGWTGGTLAGGTTGMMIQLADQLCFYSHVPPYNGNTKFPSEFFYVYSIEFYK